MDSFELGLGQGGSDRVEGRPGGSSGDSHTRRDCLVAGLSVVVVAGVVGHAVILDVVRNGRVECRALPFLVFSSIEFE